MGRDLYLGLAADGHAFPMAPDLILQERANPESVIRGGRALGGVIAEAAERYNTPLAIPLMDLSVEKEALADILSNNTEAAPTFHLDAPLAKPAIAEVIGKFRGAPTARMRATCDAVSYIAENTDSVPVGMVIGPFSLTTKLLADPIAAVYFGGAGMTADVIPEVGLLESAMALAGRAVLEYARMQLEAGAQAIVVAEPAANTTYISPNQMAQDPFVFEKYVMKHNRRLAMLLIKKRADLIFHCCGELTDAMLEEMAGLEPAVLSLGSSRCLWRDARLVSPKTVLYGNLPSKEFYSDSLITRDEVIRQSKELVRKMRETGHPFILGTECDVLSVGGREDVIRGKVEAIRELSGRGRPVCRAA